MDNKGVESVLDGYSEDEGFKWVIDSIEKCIPTAEKCGVVPWFRKPLGTRINLEKV
jgi:hypothetical protein